MTDGPRRVLGVDPGTARIGLALSDPLGLTAQPLDPLYVRGPRDAAAQIARVAREHGVVCVVIGLPRLLSGVEGTQAGAARELVERLGRSLRDVAIEVWDERLTSVEAVRALGGGARGEHRRARIDTVAAQLILQGFLDARAAAAEGPER